jgi:hypothetical protein
MVHQVLAVLVAVVAFIVLGDQIFIIIIPGEMVFNRVGQAEFLLVEEIVTISQVDLAVAHLLTILALVIHLQVMAVAIVEEVPKIQHLI